MITKEERCFQLCLRVFAAVFGPPALLCAFMPYSWMNAIHGWLGMGELCQEPIVGYLARSISAMYAMFAGMFWVLTYDIRRHRLPLCYLGAASILFGLLLLGIDLYEEMPLWWSLGEGPGTVVLGIVILLFSYRIRPQNG